MKMEGSLAGFLFIHSITPYNIRRLPLPSKDKAGKILVNGGKEKIMETWYCSHGHKFNHPDVSFWDETYYRCPICRTHQIKEHDSKPKIISKCFKCNDCRLVFSIPKEIQKHGLKICVCPRCENEMI